MCNNLWWTLIYRTLNEYFLFKEKAPSEVNESRHAELQEEKSLPQQMMERNGQEEKENCSLIGSVAKTMEGRNSTFRRKSTLYIIGDYLYVKDGLNYENNGTKVLLLRCSSSQRQCIGRAHIDQETLKVLKFPWIHSCTRDPDLKYQLQMETEMENLAETTKDRFRDIFDKVCLTHPAIATRIKFSRMKVLMHRRRKFNVNDS